MLLCFELRRHQTSESKDICSCQSLVFTIFRRWWWCLICFGIMFQDIKLRMVMVSQLLGNMWWMTDWMSSFNFHETKPNFIQGGFDSFELQWASSTSCIKHNRSHKPFFAVYLHNIKNIFLFLVPSKSIFSVSTPDTMPKQSEKN